MSVAANDPNLPVPAADVFEALAGFRRKTRAELIALIDQMADDWMKLNGIHNARAASNDWCGEYENNQESHNRHFTVLKLRPRMAGIPNPYNGRSSNNIGHQQARL